jgi:hypothetical protein
VTIHCPLAQTIPLGYGRAVPFPRGEAMHICAHCNRSFEGEIRYRFSGLGFCKKACMTEYERKFWRYMRARSNSLRIRTGGKPLPRNRM